MSNEDAQCSKTLVIDTSIGLTSASEGMNVHLVQGVSESVRMKFENVITL
jgi:hypothetical protein